MEVEVRVEENGNPVFLKALNPPPQKTLAQSVQELEEKKKRKQKKRGWEEKSSVASTE